MQFSYSSETFRWNLPKFTILYAGYHGNYNTGKERKIFECIGKISYL
jgi:hypothetical protein